MDKTAKRRSDKLRDRRKKSGLSEMKFYFHQETKELLQTFARNRGYDIKCSNEELSRVVEDMIKARATGFDRAPTARNKEGQYLVFLHQTAKFRRSEGDTINEIVAFFNEHYELPKKIETKSISWTKEHIKTIISSSKIEELIRPKPKKKGLN